MKVTAYYVIIIEALQKNNGLKWVTIVRASRAKKIFKTTGQVRRYDDKKKS